MVERTPGPYVLSDVDGTTIYSRDRMTGICACAPDPLCREHYRGGPFGGNYFAPPSTQAEQQANARFVFDAITRYDELLVLVKDYVQMLPAFRMKPIGSPGSIARGHQDDHIALENRARALLNTFKGG